MSIKACDIAGILDSKRIDEFIADDASFFISVLFPSSWFWAEQMFQSST